MSKNDDRDDEVNNHPEYELYRVYQEYFENQQKLAFDFWRQVIKSFWWYNNKDDSK